MVASVNWGNCFGCPYNKSPTVWGLYLVPLIVGSDSGPHANPRDLEAYLNDVMLSTYLPSIYLSIYLYLSYSIQ